MLSPTQGSLDRESAAQVVYALVVARASGLLFLQEKDSKAAVAIYFDDGHVINAESNLREHSLQHQLQSESALSAKAIDAAVQRVEPGRSLADVLLASRAMSASDLDRHGRVTASRIVSAVIPWTAGSYAFQEGNFVAKGRYALETESLLLRAMTQIKADHPGLQRSRSDRRCILRRDYDGSTAPSDMNVTALLAQIDGKSAAADLAAETTNPEQSIRVLYGLLLARAIEYGTATAAARSTPSSTTPKAPRTAPNPLKRGKPDASAPPKPQRPPYDSFRPISQPISDDELLASSHNTAPMETWQRDRLRELDRLFAAASAGDLLKFLAIPVGADDSTFDDAFHRVADPFHPRQNQWITDDVARTKLVFVHAKLSAAYKAARGRAPVPRSMDGFDEVSVKEKRREFTKTDRQIEAERLAQDGLRHFTAGQRLYEAKRYHDARIEVQLALKAMPDEASYHALIARIDMLNPNIRWQKESEQHWTRACELDPWNAEYRVGLAEMYKCQRLGQKARREFIHALELDPNNEKALAEIPLGERPKPREQPTEHNPE